MKKINLLFIIFIMLTGSSNFALELYNSGSRLSIYADNEPLRNILQSLADQGVTVHADPVINPSVTASFSNREIEQGLKIIFRNLNHILIWRNIDTPAGQFTRLKTIYLFKPGKKELAKILSPTSRISRNPHDGSIYIKNEILLRLSKDINLSDFKNFLYENRLSVSGYNGIAGTMKIILPENTDYYAVLDLISKFPGIEKAEPNYAYPVSNPLYSLGYAGKIPELRTGSSAGNQVPIAVIDSGLSGEYHSAPYVYASFNCLDPDEPLEDYSGHGTHMAMIAGGAVRPVGTGNESVDLNPVIAIKGYDEDGYISNYDLFNGIEFAMNNGARVLSLSWGSETDSDFLEEALDNAASKGMIILGAAGNEATGKNMYPAAYNSVIGVGALDPAGKKWDKSNYGDFVTVYAPGFASFPEGSSGEPGTYAGTSISTAYTANLVAGYISKNPEATIKEILAALSDESENNK